MKFQREILTERLLQEMQPLLMLHYGELSNRGLDLEPAEWIYLALEKAGRLLVVTARDKYGALCGYHVMTIQGNMHYDSTDAISDVLYLLPRHRKGTAGGRLMAASKRIAKELGADTVVWRAKPNTDLDRTLSKRLPVQDHTYIERL